MSKYLSCSELILQTAEQEERALRIESDIQTARNMCHGLFRNSRTAVRACDIPFQGWSSSQIVSLMLEDVVNKVSIFVYRLKRSIIWMIGCTDHQEVHQRVHQNVASRQVQTEDGPQNCEGRVHWGYGESHLCGPSSEWVRDGKMIFIVYLCYSLGQMCRSALLS